MQHREVERTNTIGNGKQQKSETVITKTGDPDICALDFISDAKAQRDGRRLCTGLIRHCLSLRRWRVRNLTSSRQGE